jgi:hypothetical protein
MSLVIYVVSALHQTTSCVGGHRWYTNGTVCSNRRYYDRRSLKVNDDGWQQLLTVNNHKLNYYVFLWSITVEIHYFYGITIGVEIYSECILRTWLGSWCTECISELAKFPRTYMIVARMGKVHNVNAKTIESNNTCILWRDSDNIHVNDSSAIITVIW